ncbi:MAG: hypothetical protein HDKAJFGB_03235 [Anaerolineae bacterium]|nr:hypothetical protein [Anaerolineae bacterium]
MRFRRPHVRVQRVRVQTVAVGFLLRVRHEFAQFLDRPFARATPLEYALFKQKAARNIHHDLTRALQRIFQNRQLFLRVRLTQRRLFHNRFAKDARRFRQRHGRTALNSRARRKRQIVIRMSEFVRERTHPAERGFEIGQHARLGCAHAHTKRAIAFPRARFRVNPMFVERALRQALHFFRVRTEMGENKFARVVVRPHARIRAERRKNIVKGESLQPQRARFGAEITPKRRERFARRAEHGVQRRAVNRRVKNRFVQRGFPMTARRKRI